MSQEVKKSFVEMHKDVEILKSMRILFEYCESHPTCENCQFRLNHKGCAFRHKTPREWFG